MTLVPDDDESTEHMVVVDVGCWEVLGECVEHGLWCVLVECGLRRLTILREYFIQVKYKYILMFGQFEYQLSNNR